MAEYFKTQKKRRAKARRATKASTRRDFSPERNSFGICLERIGGGDGTRTSGLGRNGEIFTHY